MSRILDFIYNIFNKKEHRHICVVNYTHIIVKAKTRYNGSFYNGKGKMRQLFDVYYGGACKECGKTHKDKVATSIPRSRVYSRFSISLK